ncbi:MAG TPA: adenylate/guanylate cyclase domain-containing protein [Chthoniobacterales bacterium]
MNWLARYRPAVFATICLFWTAVIIAGHFFVEIPFLSFPWRAEQGFQDLLRREGRQTPVREDFVFVGIDQSSLEMPPLSPEELANNRAFQLMTEHSFPWSRELWALLLDRLFNAGARMVLFDMVFNPPNEGDPAFHAALDRYRDRVVIGENFDTQNSAQLVVPNPNLIPPPAEDDDRVGFVNYFNDPIDGKLRAARFFTSDRQLAGLPPHPSEKLYASLPTRALTKLGREADAIHDQRDHLFRFSPNDAYLPHPLYELFDPKFWQANYAEGAFFKNKVVIVGASAQILHDFIDTPMSPSTPGPAVHLQVIAAALAHEFLRPTTPRVMLGLVVAAGAAAWSLVTLLRRPLLCLLSVLAISAVYLVVARIAYDRSGLLLTAVPVLSAFLLVGASTLGLDYAIERMEKLRTRRTLERYVSRNLVKEILENPDSYYSSMRGARKPVTVLFSDLVGFTTLSEKADPEELVRQLNQYLSHMVGVVFENGGTLDKFIGDAIMAVWGNVKSQGVAKDARDCAYAALAMRRELKKLNDGWKLEGRMTLGMGVGINQGEVLIGNIGSYEPHERLDPTVIGDVVNLASRLEGLTRIYGVDILVGTSAAELIRNEFYLRSVARAQVKGKTEPVDVFTIVNARDGQPDQQLLIWLETYEQGIRKFRDRDFIQAKILFSRYLEFYPEDYLAKIYLDRSLEYEQEPPDEAWNAVEVFHKK